MDALAASKTAMVTSLMRAVHTRCDPAPILDDSWGDRLLPEAALQLLEKFAVAAAGEAVQDSDDIQAVTETLLRDNPAYANVIVRARYTEDALASMVASGVTQYVLIGAGFDSYALRKPPGAQHLDVYEVDHPATQSLKTHQLAACGVSGDRRHHFIPADLGEEDLGAALSRSSFDGTRPAFFSWLGVTMYLSREANMATLESVARCSAPGSQLVFSYIDQALFDAGTGAEKQVFNELEQSVRSVDEPFISGFNPADLARVLEGVGLVLEEDLSDIQLAAHYDPDGLNAFRSTDKSRLARVSVPGS
jgi:methyltransferase (TIGR00027 family)